MAKNTDIYTRMETMSLKELEETHEYYKRTSAVAKNPRSRYHRLFYRAATLLNERKKATK